MFLTATQLRFTVQKYRFGINGLIRELGAWAPTLGTHLVILVSFSEKAQLATHGTSEGGKNHDQKTWAKSVPGAGDGTVQQDAVVIVVEVGIGVHRPPHRSAEYPLVDDQV